MKDEKLKQKIQRNLIEISDMPDDRAKKFMAFNQNITNLYKSPDQIKVKPLAEMKSHAAALKLETKSNLKGMTNKILIK